MELGEARSKCDHLAQRAHQSLRVGGVLLMDLLQTEHYETYNYSSRSQSFQRSSGYSRGQWDDVALKSNLRLSGFVPGHENAWYRFDRTISKWFHEFGDVQDAAMSVGFEKIELIETLSDRGRIFVQCRR
jgi:hypothetical protein